MRSNTSRVGEIAEIVDSLHKTPKYSATGWSMVRATDVKYGPLRLDQTYKVDDEVYAQFARRYKPSIGDIVITRVGSYGNTAYVQDVDFCLGQNTTAIIPKINARYLFLALNSPQLKHQIDSLVVGSTQKTLSLKAISNLEIPRFDLKAEDFIADVCGQLDDKIQLNHQINQTLEQMAQAIFKSWFVDFEPVKAKVAALEAGGSEDDALLAAMQAIAGSALFTTDAADADAPTQLARLQTEHPEQYTTLRATAELFPSAMQESELGEIPEGWNIGYLADLLDFNPRRTLKKGTVAPYLDMKNVPTSGHLADEVVDREMGSGTKFINGDTLLARITPCLENGKTAYVDFLDEGQVGWGSTEYIVIRPKNDYPTSIGYLIARNAQFRQHAIQSMTGTSGRQRANAKALAELPWVIYPKNIMHIFDKVAGVYLELAKNKGDESKALSELRDTLLPKLLSGELRINNDVD